MLYFVIGTKAQFIKMAPVMQAASDKGVRWKLVDMGQHADITGRILKDFKLNGDVLHLLPEQETVADYGGAARWLSKLSRLLLFPRKLRRHVFAEHGVALVHGDTLSTLFGALLARRAGVKVALVEAGLTSGRLLSPFPEEIIRRLCERLAQHLFAPGAEASDRLRRRGATVINTGYNTGRDALNLQTNEAVSSREYLLMTLHRLETLRSPSRLSRAVKFIEAVASRELPLTLILHPPTKLALEKTGYLKQLSNNADVQLVDLLPYPQFLALMKSARVVMTDGGSVQEECSYLGKACIVLRDETERPHGIGLTAFLTSWSGENDLPKALQLHGKPMFETTDRTASEVVVDAVINLQR